MPIIYRNFIHFIWALLFLSACAFYSCSITITKPKIELSLAAESFQAAKDAKAEQYAPREYRIAELSFLKAKNAYQKKFFSKAKEYALLCRKYSELAEYRAIKERLTGANNESNSESNNDVTADSNLKERQKEESAKTEIQPPENQQKLTQPVKDLNNNSLNKGPIK